MPVDLRLLDEIATAATVAPIEVDLDGWWCKAAPELPFRRCNVALPPVGAAADPAAFEEALGRVRTWYHDQDLRLIVQVSSADPDAAALDAALEATGLDVEAPVLIMVAGIDAPIAGGAGSSIERVRVAAGIDEGWARAYGTIHGGGATQQQRTEAYGRMLAAFGDRALGASCSVDGRIVGVGFGVVDRGWVGIFGMGVAPEHRRQGIATDIVRALCAASEERGAAKAYLQVETDNDGAIRLYDGLGFERSHGYHYRSEPTSVAIGC